MFRTADAPGPVLAAGLLAVGLAALAPAGLDGRAVPAWAWALWAGVFVAALAALRAAGVPLPAACRRVLWLLPMIALLALPAAVLATPGRRTALALALGARAFSAAAAATALATTLGPAGLVRGARALRAPARLVEVLAAMLAGLAVVTRQAGAMARARAARRPGHGAWPALLASPLETVRGFGRLVAALLLRSLERGEALERARRARAGADE